MSWWLWVIPFIIAIVIWEVVFRPHVIRLWVLIFPFLADLGAIAWARL